MTKHTIDQLWGWTREELIDAVQTLETQVEELSGLEHVRMEMCEDEYPFELEIVSGDEEYKD